MATLVAPRMMFQQGQQQDQQGGNPGAGGNPYQNQLAQLLQDPGSFSGTPGFQFARDQALQGISRSNSRQRGSGNVLAALADRSQGMAMQDYGNQRDFLGRMTGQQQQYDLGAEANRLTGARDANNYSLGSQQNTNTAQKNAWDYSLGSQANTNTANANNQQFGLGMYRAGNDYDLGSQQNANTAQNNWWNHQANSEQNANSAASNQNNYNVNMYNAQTNRGQAQSQDWWNPQRQARQPLTQRIV